MNIHGSGYRHLIMPICGPGMTLASSDLTHEMTALALA
jgi:hypothetical protein